MKPIVVTKYTLKKDLYKTLCLFTSVGLKPIMHKVKYLFLFFLISSMNINYTDEVVEKISFNIVKKDSNIGYINIEKKSKDETTTYTIHSEVNAKLIFNFKATGKEKSVYINDKLVFSSMYRKINNTIKIDETLSLIDGKYFLFSGNNKTFIREKAIHKNLSTLFFYEPIGFNKVYSDKYKTMIDIQELGNHSYKITLPNGSTSVYRYRNGKCTMVELKGSFYKVELIRT